MKNSIVLFVNIFSISFLFAQVDCLDIDFGDEGKVTTSIGTQEDIGISVVIQPDGNLILAGNSKNEGDYEIALVRYNNDGSLDDNFGMGGKVTTDIGTGNDYTQECALQADGKIVVVGNSFNVGDYSDISLIRYNYDGSIDNTFGVSGIVTADCEGHYDFGKSLAIGDDGKIVVFGNFTSSSSGSSDFVLLRYLSDGSIDSSFGKEGKVVIDYGYYDHAHKVLLQSDGKIVIVGRVSVQVGYNFFLCRLNDIGNIDSTFGQGGKVTTDFGEFSDTPVSAVLQQDGKILVVGGVPDNLFSSPFKIARYNVNGSLDSTFGQGGKVTTDFDDETQASDMAWSVALQPDGKIVVAGRTSLWFALARYNIDGSLDNSYCSEGKVITKFENLSNSSAKSVLIQPDNKIVSAGFAIVSSQGLRSKRFALVRYLPDLSVDVVNLRPSINSISIHPNPAQQNTTLEYTLLYPEEISIYLLDVWGHTVVTIIENQKQEAAFHQRAITLPDYLPSGIYIVEISSANSRVNIKIVK